MKNGILFLDGFDAVKPKVSKAICEFIAARPTFGKSKIAKKALKKINKRRKKLGLKKIKTVEYKLPANWKLFA